MKHLFLFLFLSIIGSGFAAEESGTLVVSYHTDDHGSRLNRVRFWLRDSQGRQLFFPKEGGYIEENGGKSRLVVIDHLKSGNYTLEFLVPNRDDFFEGVQPRHVTVSKGNTVRIEQVIKPKEKNEENAPEPVVETTPMTLGVLRIVTDIDKTRVSLYKENELYEEEIVDGLGELHLPAGIYRIFFEHREGAPHQPQFVDVEVVPNKTQEISANYFYEGREI